MATNVRMIDGFDEFCNFYSLVIKSDPDSTELEAIKIRGVRIFKILGSGTPERGCNLFKMWKNEFEPDGDSALRNNLLGKWRNFSDEQRAQLRVAIDDYPHMPDR